MNNKIENLEEKVQASILLASLFDTIGFKNGLYEFKPDNEIPASSLEYSTQLTSYIISDYFILGGFQYFPIKNLNASDDTLLLLATTEAVVKGGGELNYINQYLKWYPIIAQPKRAIGVQTNKSLKLLKNKIKKKESSYIHHLKYDKLMGGNGAAIRTASIGIKWYNNINKIIEESIIASRVTHNFYIGFLGGMVSAIFTSYAINNIKPWLWLDNLLKLHENNVILNYIHSTDFKNTIDDDINNFFYYFYKYKEERFKNIITNRYKADIINVYKLDSFVEYNKALYDRVCENKGYNYRLIATTGLDVILYSYESLLLSIVPNSNYTVDLDNAVYSWESLAYFSCLHIGDSDSTGVIVGAWIGALNGYKNFNKERLHDLEFYKELKDVSNKLFKQL